MFHFHQLYSCWIVNIHLIINMRRSISFARVMCRKQHRLSNPSNVVFYLLRKRHYMENSSTILHQFVMLVLARDLKNYVKNCNICHRIKTSKRKQNVGEHIPYQTNQPNPLFLIFIIYFQHFEAPWGIHGDFGRQFKSFIVWCQI